jgi:RNA polymerase sigma-70 factor (ECF subfamily)
VLHDVFDVPFQDIAPVVRRSPAAARQLASRARRRVRGPAGISDADLAHQRAVVDAFLAALRAGDIPGVLAVLDPAIVRRADRAAVPPGAPRELPGASRVAEETLRYRGLARFARPILVDGSVGIVVAPRGRLRFVIRCTVRGARIVEMDVIAESARLHQLGLAVLAD